MFLFEILPILARWFELIAVLLLVWGGLVVVLRLIVSEGQHLIGKSNRIRFEEVRIDFGQRIVLATEFLIVADLIRTILDPSLEELIGLGGIVTIRTVLSFFLTKEIDRHERLWKSR